jgi:hypothetical protein
MIYYAAVMIFKNHGYPIAGSLLLFLFLGAVSLRPLKIADPGEGNCNLVFHVEEGSSPDGSLTK